MKLVEDVEPEEMSFVDDKNGNLFLCEDVGKEIADEREHFDDGVGGWRIAESDADLHEKFPERAGGGDDGDDAVLGWVKAGDSSTKGGALAGTDVAGDDGGKSIGDGVVEAVDERGEAGEREKVLDGNILVEGFPGESPSGGEGDHTEPSLPKSEPDLGVGWIGGSGGDVVVGGEGRISVVWLAVRRMRELAY